MLLKILALFLACCWAKSGLTDAEVRLHASMIACMNLGYAYLNDNQGLWESLEENTTLRNQFATKIMHHTITKCMDHASDEQKNASYINFKEGDPYFDYKSVFNSTFFIEAEPLLKNHSLLEPT